MIPFSTEADDPPVSYGYNADSTTLYYRLAFPPGSSKEEVLDSPVSFVTHDRTDEGWRSVVASGRVGEIEDRPYEPTAVQEMWSVRIPSVDIFDRPPGDVTFRHFRLVPETLGRKEFTS